MTPLHGVGPAPHTPTRRAVAVISWRLVVWILIAATAWDAAGLTIGGNTAYASPDYDVLRHIAPWGMRTYGPTLAVLLLAAVYSYGRHAAHPGHLLPWCLSLLAAWYAAWTVGVIGAWVVHQQVGDWGAVSRLGVLAVLLVVCARAAPTHGR